MGRKRKSADASRLPKYVYLAKGRYVWRPYQDGKLAAETVLCPADAPISKVWAAWEALQADGAPRRSLRWLIDQYLSSADYRRLAPKTQRDYDATARRICGAKLRNGAEFGGVDIGSITPGVLRKYVDRRSESAPVAANRELALLSVAFSWALERDMVKLNPAKGVRKNTEHARDRYVSDADYLLVYRMAGERYPYLAPIMELAYLCRMRLAEVLDLTKANIGPDGLHVIRRKGSRDNITTWTPRLREAVDAALALPRPFASLDPARHYLIPGKAGGRQLEATVGTAWRRIMPEALKAGLSERFTVHDLKAKGITDTDPSEKMAGGGHKSPSMLNVYDRLPRHVKPSKE